MSARTTSTFVDFQRAFRLGKVPETFPAGRYEVEKIEDVIESASRQVYHRVATYLLVRSAGSMRTVSIDPADLDVALAADLVTD